MILSKLPSAIPTTVFALAILLLPIAALTPVRSGEPVIVVGTPWRGRDAMIAVIAEAEGAILRGTLVPFIAIGRSDRADFHAQLHRAGAWITLDAWWATGCRSEATLKDVSGS